MKCLTVLQPYAHLLCGLAPGDERQKRVENRTHDRFKGHRGLLLIHAGKDKRMLLSPRYTAAVVRDFSPNLYGLDPKTLPLGAIVGAVDMVSHFELGHMKMTIGACIINGMEIIPPGTSHTKVIPVAEVCDRPWLQSHQHVEGPHCLVFGNIRRFREPIPCKGAQGLWNLPAELESKVKEQLEKAEVLS